MVQYRKEGPATHQPITTSASSDPSRSGRVSTRSRRRHHRQNLSGRDPAFSRSRLQAIVSHQPKNRHARRDLRFKRPCCTSQRQAQHRRRPQGCAQGAGGADPALQADRPGAPRARLPLCEEVAGFAGLQQIPDHAGDQHRRHRQCGFARFFRRRRGPARGPGHRLYPALGQGERLYQGARAQGLWRQCRQMAEGAPDCSRRQDRTVCRHAISRNAAAG